jgi:hypothetical protein
MPTNASGGGFDQIGQINAERVDAILAAAKRMRSQEICRRVAAWGKGVAAAFRALFVEPFAHRRKLPPQFRQGAGMPSSPALATGLLPESLHAQLQRVCAPENMGTRDFRDDTALGHRISATDEEPEAPAVAREERKAAA